MGLKASTHPRRPIEKVAIRRGHGRKGMFFLNNGLCIMYYGRCMSVFVLVDTTMGKQPDL